MNEIGKAMLDPDAPMAAPPNAALRGNISSELERIHSAIAALDGVLGALQERIRGVVQPAPPTAAKGCSAEDGSSVLASHLCGEADLLFAMGEQVQSLIDRVDL